MNHRPLTAALSLAIAFFVTACDDQPTSPRAGHRPRAAISDAANGGANAAVYFLPPITERPNIVGTFNPNVGTAVIQVCRVDGTASDCVGDPIASFGASQPTGPLVVSSDHYLAVWRTVDSDPPLVVGAAYRIEVFTDDPADVANLEPIAWADVQVVESGKELRNLRTNDIVGLLPDGSLPIKVWLGTDVRCRSDNCVTQRVDNTGGTVVLETGNGALVLQSGWLPPGFEEATVTLQREPTGTDNDCVGKAAYSGPGLVAQREACLEVTTDPVIPRDVGIQRPAFIFVCSETDETDPLNEFLQVIKADDGVPLQALRDVEDAELVALGFEPQCEGTPPPPIGFEAHPLMRLANRGVRAITQPLARLLEVKPLYAIDLGQGGEIPIGGFFSYFTLGVQASAARFGTLPPAPPPAGSVVPLSIRVTGKTNHASDPALDEGIPAVDVTFRIVEGEGSLGEEGEETVQTNADGVASVSFSPSSGVNVVEAVALVDGEPVTLPVTFSVTASAPAVFAGSVVVFKDIDAFNNNWVDDPNNAQLVQNLVGFGGAEPRASENTVYFDHGKDSFCGPAPYSACAGLSDLKNIVNGADFHVVDVTSSPTSTPLINIADSIKVIFLVAPQEPYTAAEISGLKQFAAEGGRIVYLADYCNEGAAYCGGVETQNALMSALGAAITHVDGVFGSAATDLPVSILPHQITTGMEDWQTAGVGALQLGSGATPLIVFEDETTTHILAAVAPVNVTPPIP